VVKVESPEGDNMRHVGPMVNPGMGHIFLQANQGKRSLVLDLKQPAAREAVLRLAEQSDVLISNVRPQALARLGLDPAPLQRRPGRGVALRLFPADRPADAVDPASGEDAADPAQSPPLGLSAPSYGIHSRTVLHTRPHAIAAAVPRAGGAGNDASCAAWL
jgi:hypothetical protein